MSAPFASSAVSHWALANVGWLATAVFTASYFARGEARLRALQMAGASLWLLYGAVIGAAPVIVANLLVLAAAIWTTLAPRRRRPARPRGVDREAPAPEPFTR